MPVASGLFGDLQESTSLDRTLRVVGNYFLERGVERLVYHHHPPAGAEDYDQAITVEHWGFPEEWVAEYTDKEYYRVDPITRRAMRNTRPFWWSEIVALENLQPAQKDYLKELHKARIGDGLAVPVFGPRGRNGYVGLGFGVHGRELPEHRVATYQMAAQIGHQRYCEILINGFEHVRLSPREEEILGWAARGKSNTVIADILGLSSNTVDTHFRRIFAKLGVNERVTAVLRGMALGLVV